MRHGGSYTRTATGEVLPTKKATEKDLDPETDPDIGAVKPDQPAKETKPKQD